jgi:hypothetical protein
MAARLPARHKGAFAMLSLAAALMLLCGPGSALAANRVVFAESFVNTG